MTISTVAHLNFRGQAREALEFYHSVFGGQLMIGTYGDGGVPHDSATSEKATFDPVSADTADAGHVSFGMVMGEDGFRLAAYDVYGADDDGLANAGLDAATTRSAGLTHSEPFFIVLNGSTRAEIAPLFDKLSTGGTVIQNLVPSDFSPAYGMLTDRYGVTWIFGAMS